MSIKFYFLITAAVFILGVPLHASQTERELEQKTLASQTAGQKRVDPRLNQTLLDTAIFDNAARVKKLLSTEEIPDVNAKDYNGMTALIRAAFHGNTVVAQTLIDAGADLDAADKHDLTALMWAALNGHPAIVQALIAAGANPMLQNKKGKTALMSAKQAIQKNPQKIEKMLQDAENAYMAKRMNLPERALEIGFATTGQNALPEEAVASVHEYLGVTRIPTHPRAKPSIP